MFNLRPAVEEVMEIMGTSFKRSQAPTGALSAPTLQQATTDSRLCWRLLDTHRQVWVSLSCSLLLSPGSWCAQGFVCALHMTKSLFPQSCVSSVIKSHWPPKSNYLGVVSPFARSQVGKSVVGSGSFLTVQEFLWYDRSALCGSSAWGLYGWG